MAKMRTLTIRIECQTSRSLKELSSLAVIAFTGGPIPMTRKTDNDPVGEIVQVSVDVAQPARAPKRRGSK